MQGFYFREILQILIYLCICQAFPAQSVADQEITDLIKLQVN